MRILSLHIKILDNGCDVPYIIEPIFVVLNLSFDSVWTNIANYEYFDENDVIFFN